MLETCQVSSQTLTCSTQELSDINCARCPSLGSFSLSLQMEENRFLLAFGSLVVPQANMLSSM